ncbi:protein unc-79 homolog isoform X2 [Nilaparvata lugens]|uniref:protein unc-79 homolog isoform X2 n=1 Tax=Nilaparvata lugens TaxID=108931 RepID=UPI00193D5236|nr:protein unc-79 homolog isoform X2 [Nilaparvata lugens]
MMMKGNLVKDMLCVIAYGTSGARASAAKLLFYYWPTFNSSLFERKGVPPKFTTDWTPFTCQRDTCTSGGMAEAAKVCYDHCISITYAAESPPPLYLCIECANEIHRDHPNQQFHDILHPMQQASVSCENKNCRSSDKSVVSICFTMECASYNSNHPIRYCMQCHGLRHNNKRGGDHIVHKCLPKAWQMDDEMHTYLVEAIISLLKEARPSTPDLQRDLTDIQAKAAMLNVININPLPNISLEERQLMGRFGVWLLVGLCTPNPKTPSEIIGRLLSMLFHWFHVTAYTFDDQAECTLERLKTDYVCGWLSEVLESHHDTFVSCLLPHPAEYARVGGHWDMLVSRTSHLKNGLNRLFCLVPYEVITTNIWDDVMPHWLEAIVKDVPENELPELKMLLSKILDPDMSPLGFDAKKLYQFVSIRFKQTTPKVQEQALNWLQVLTALEIVIPLHLLFSFFEEGINSLKQTGSSNEEEKRDGRKTSISPVVEDEGGGNGGLSDDEAKTTRSGMRYDDIELKLSCCVLMLDIVLKQMERHEVERYTGMHTVVAQDVSRLLQSMLCLPWLSSASGTHAHSHSQSHAPPLHSCPRCDLSIIWHQLALHLVEYIAPENLAHPPDPPVEDSSLEEGGHGRKSPPDSERKSEPKPDVVINMPLMEIHSVGGIMTATVETVVEQLDLAPIIMAERIPIPQIARAVTLTDADVATAKVCVQRHAVVGENDQPVDSLDEDMDDFWPTSVGKFKFSIEELPQQLQFIHQVLKELSKTESPVVLYYLVQSLHLMVLHGDALNKATKDHRGFIIWCQETLLIKNLWDLCNAEYSHICEVCVPILLHCITLPSGSDVFWRVIKEEFHTTDWKVRFDAVGRVAVIARFMDSTPLRTNLQLQAALANAFCYLISSMDDLNVQVAQRATLYLGTIHDTAIKSLIMCLETQFDSVIVDRPMVLQSLYQLHNCLSDRKILTWEFFLNRFDALFIEAQISLEKSGDIAYLRDLRNNEVNSELFVRKLHRAQEALSLSDGSSAKTLSASFGQKWPYKRTMSAPASMVPRQGQGQADESLKLIKEREKIYSRQYSAPILKRKSSRFGLGGFVGTMTPNSSNVMPDGHIHSINANDDVNLTAFLHRVIDLEEADRETIHLLVFLLMQFLSRSDQAYPSDEKIMAKHQHIVLRHFYLLLGYNLSENKFHITPTRLRSSPVFNVFISNLPQLLDQNHLMGGMLVAPHCALVANLLHFCPAPPHLSDPCQPNPTYSLWLLEPHVRHSWLMALLVLLYKYQYSTSPLSQQMQTLVRIVINTLDSQHHVCKHIPPTVYVGGPPSRSRDVSQPSLGVDGEGGGGGDKMETPPLSPMYSGDGAHAPKGKTTAMYHQKSPGSMETHWEEDSIHLTAAMRAQGSTHSTEADETESELAAIPESCGKSDSTIHGSSPGSLDDDDADKKKIGDCSVKYSRPVWILGSDESTNEVTEKVASSNCQKLGIKEGMKMLVTSSLFSGGGPRLPPPLPTTVMVAAAPAILHPPPPTTHLPPSNPIPIPVAAPQAQLLAQDSIQHSVTPQRSLEKEHSSEKEGDSCSQHGSPIPRQQRRLAEGNQTPTSTSSSTPTPTPTAHPPWQIETPISHLRAQQQLQQQHVAPPPPPPQERLLPIGGGSNHRMIARPTLARACTRSYEETTGSPESPMSKMMLMPPIGSPNEVDSENNLSHSDQTSLHSVSQLEIPLQERLLVFGNTSIPSLVQHVHQALGVKCDRSHKYGDTGVTTQSPSDVDSLSYTKQESFEKSDTPHCLRSVSPRRLLKQSPVMLDSPPASHPPPDMIDPFRRTLHGEDGARGQRQKCKKGGLFSIGSHFTDHPRRPGNWCAGSQQSKTDLATQTACHASLDLKQSSYRIGDDCLIDRCGECGAPKEEYSDEELGLCIVIIGTFIHREPALAAQMLPDILTIIAKLALSATYPWQSESNVYLPGGAISVAHQFLRCVLHQLAPNGVFVQMFQTHVHETARMQFFRSVSQALLDFNELNPIAPLQLLLESLNSKKCLEGMPLILFNMACYLDCLPLEAGLGPGSGTWNVLLVQLELLFRRLALQLSSLHDIVPLLRIMISVLRVPGIANCKGILEPFSKVLSHAIQHHILKYHFVVDLCYLCNKAFTREREKQVLTRTVVFELVQVLKFKTSIPDSNFLLLINFILQDAGGLLPLAVAMEDNPPMFPDGPVFATSAAEAMRHHLGDAVEFLSDFHTLSKIKSICTKNVDGIGLNEDTIGGMLKSGVAQYVALEMMRGNGRDNRAVARNLPWLYNIPSSAQQGPREFLDCVCHVRMLSWLLLGALTHTSLHTSTCLPIPQDASCNIADHVQVIMSGFAEQSKASVLHMSALYHAFVLCQLWTVYLEHAAANNLPSSELHSTTMGILFDFWGKVTPSILQLIQYTKVLAEMVNLHFLNLLEALIECNSTVLSKLMPVWKPILLSNQVQMPAHMLVRLQACCNQPPVAEVNGIGGTAKQPANNILLLRWLQRLQFKMGQIELQSSVATTFYSL